MARSRYLIATSEQPRVRRAADVTGAIAGVLAFVWSLRLFQGVADVEARSAQYTDWVPGWLEGVLSVVYTGAFLYALILLIGVATQWRTRRDAARDTALALATTTAFSLIAVKAVSGSWPMLVPELGLFEPVAEFPAVRIALVASALLVLAPHLTRPVRRVGWFVLIAGSLAAVGLGLGLPSSAVAAIGLGAATAGAVLVLFGSPRGYPDLASIDSGLRDLGLAVADLRLDDDQSWGVRRLLADTPDHGRVEIKAYGRDATDSQLAARAWRYLWYRDTTPSLALTRMQSVEHEALVTMMAERAGASVTSVLAAGLGGDDVALLAIDRSGERMSALDPGSISDDDLVALWRSVSRLHASRISHGSLNTSVVSVTPDGPQIGDLGYGDLVAPDSAMAMDVVELMVSLAALIGTERSVASASIGLGEERLAEVLPYIQLPALRSGTKRDLDKPKVLVKEVHDRVIELTGTEQEEPVQVTRVRVKSLLMAAVTLFAVYFLVTALAGIDFESVWEELQSAEWLLVLVAFLVAQTMYFPEATGMLAAVGYPIPLKPAVVLQSAIKFVGLAVPGTAGRVAMQAGFLHKYGLSFARSMVQGSIDTISGLVVEIVVLVLAVLSGTLSLGLDTTEVEWGLILAVVVGIVLLVVYLVRRVQKLREWVLPLVGEAWDALKGVLKDPKRTLGLLASNFGSRFVLAVAMSIILASMDVSLGIWSVLTATVATGLLGGIVPVPGGVGVTEAILASFLVLFGVDEATAFAAAVVYRFATFYIPSGAGYLSMRWLERNGYL